MGFRASTYRGDLFLFVDFCCVFRTSPLFSFSYFRLFLLVSAMARFLFGHASPSALFVLPFFSSRSVWFCLFLCLGFFYFNSWCLLELVWRPSLGYLFLDRPASCPEPSVPDLLRGLPVLQNFLPNQYPEVRLFFRFALVFFRVC